MGELLCEQKCEDGFEEGWTRVYFKNIKSEKSTKPIITFWFQILT